MMDLTQISSLTGWPDTRKKIEDALRNALSTPSHEPVDLQLRVAEENEVRGVTRRLIVFFLSETEMVTGWLFIPEGKEDAPAILCCHQESLHGKDEAAGIDGAPRLAFAQHYAELGYVTLAIDVPTVGRRAQNKREPYDIQSFGKENKECSFAGKMLADHMRTLDVFSELKRVDTTRIGVIGHGLGAFNALLLAAFDDRIQACVASCGFSRFATAKTHAGQWPGMERLILLPDIVKAASKGNLPFDWEHILALAAPTPVQLITSMSNSIHENPKSCQKAITIASKIYKLLGAQSALDHYMHHDGHVITPETLEVADEWFERWL